MLFNTYVFLLAFLPISILGFIFLGRIAPRRVAIAWLVLCSLYYYGYWNWNYLTLILFSILFNFTWGIVLTRQVRGFPPKTILAIGVIVNLGLLGFFKYAGLTITTINLIPGIHIPVPQIVLPIAISFFTFQQIAYLVDAYKGETREYNFIDYMLFVTFFPQLIAGPIVHHKEMLPQFARLQTYKLNTLNISIGMTFFIIGLFKKTVIADNVAAFVSPIFDGAARQYEPNMYEAWVAAIGYTLHLYFDFSGYSDMAIGIGRMIGVKLPINFNSPYKSINAIDLWRRWHMTLSRFLREYLYIPLGGNRKGKARRYINLMITMLLGGLWHGAGWNFMFWGGLHGIYLCSNHAYGAFKKSIGIDITKPKPLWNMALCRLLTFLAYVFSLVFFRSADFATSGRMLGGMFGYGPEAFALVWEPKHLTWLIWIVVLLAFVWCLPNTQELLGRFHPALGFNRRRDTETWLLKRFRWLHWYPNQGWAIFMALLSAATLFQLFKVSEFIYYQF